MILSLIQSLKLASHFPAKSRKKQNMKASSDKKHRFFCFQKENNYLCNSKLHDIGFNQLVIKGVINGTEILKAVYENKKFNKIK